MAAVRTQATTTLDRRGFGYELHPYQHDAQASSYGQEAADALGIPPDRIFKTLVADVDGELVVAVVPVSGQLDLRALAAAVGGKKARMADGAAAERATGFVTGGIAPLGHRKQLPVVIDSTVGRFDTVFCSAGRRGLQLELGPSDLVSAAAAQLAAIGR